MDPQGLFRVEDVNSIIKLFAFSIQQRFQQIDGIPKNQDQNRYLPSQTIQDSQYLIRKYRNYLTHQQKQIKYLEKLVIRIIQILQFFKQRSKSQQILTLLIKKVQEKLNKIVKSLPVDVEWLYSYIIDLAKNGFQVKKSNTRQRRYSLKKIQLSEQKTSQQLERVKKQQNNDSIMQKRTVSTANGGRPRRQVSLSAKRMVKNQQTTKQSLQSQISKLYEVLEIDVSHLQKIAQTKDKTKIERQSIRQNAQNLTAILSYQKNYHTFSKKKQKTESILVEVNNRTSIRPILNNWISRKRKINQNKKRLTDSENVSIL